MRIIINNTNLQIFPKRSWKDSTDLKLGWDIFFAFLARTNDHICDF